MNKFIMLFFLFLLVGCSEPSMRGVKSPATLSDSSQLVPPATGPNPVLAVDPDTGKCDAKGASKGAVVACLRLRIKRMTEYTQHPQKTNHRGAAAVPSSLLSMLPSLAGGGGGIGGTSLLAPGFYPKPTGARCEVAPALGLSIENDTQYDVQVYTPGGDVAHQQLAPLGCDAVLTMEYVPISINGRVVETLMIRPHSTAKFAFLPKNGGWGNVSFNVEGWLRLLGQNGEVPANEVGYSTIGVSVPNRVLPGEPNTWRVYEGTFDAHRY